VLKTNKQTKKKETHNRTHPYTLKQGVCKIFVFTPIECAGWGGVPFDVFHVPKERTVNIASMVCVPDMPNG
jgi:hypothetical protein